MVVFVSPRPVLLLLMGAPPDPVREAHGEFPAWFERVWGGPLERVDARLGLPAGKGPDAAGVVVTGSPRSLVRPEPWMDDAADFVRRAHQAGTPLLGVCFGHQLIGHAFGGRVAPNPAGWEMGSHEVELTDEGRADPLFAGLPERLQVNLAHQDHVEIGEPSASISVLARNAATPLQAIAVGEHTRGVQFHPEFSGEIVRAYIEARRPLLVGRDPDALVAGAADSRHGEAILHNFRKNFVEKA